MKEYILKAWKWILGILAFLLGIFIFTEMRNWRKQKNLKKVVRILKKEIQKAQVKINKAKREKKKIKKNIQKSKKKISQSKAKLNKKKKSTEEAADFLRKFTEDYKEKK